MAAQELNVLSPQSYHLAQINVALMKAPLDDPSMTEFAAALNEVNAVADRSPGFVWRLQTASGNAADIQAYSDPKMLINLSVWQSVEQIKDYVYKTLHGEFFIRRRNWFERYQGEHLALWWIPADCLPTVEEGKAKLEQLALTGDSPECFTFAKPYSPPVTTQPLIDTHASKMRSAIAK
jgi:hypothetical protein